MNQYTNPPSQYQPEQQKQKAWLKISYDQQSYEPVIILYKINKNKSVVVDELSYNDGDEGYEVQNSMLMPRTQMMQLNNLAQAPYINFPEIQQKLSQKSGVDSIQRNKYLPVGNNLIIDLSQPSQNQNDRNKNMSNHQLQNFYNRHLHNLLTKQGQSQKVIIIAAKQKYNPHCYLSPLIEILNNKPEFWPHKLKINKLNYILEKILFNVSVEIKIGFIQCQANSQENNNNNNNMKTMLFHIKPYLTVVPTNGLALTNQLKDITNNSKFHQMYQGPVPLHPNRSSTDLQNIINSFLNLGVQIKIIHSLMRLLSVIANLDRMQVDKQVNSSSISGNGSKRKLRLCTINPNQNQQDCQDSLEKIERLTGVKGQRLEKLIIYGQDQVQEQDGEDMDYLEDLGTKKQIAVYRLNIIKYIFYEMFITQTCQIINKRLCTQNFVNQSISQYQMNQNSQTKSSQYKNKFLVVLSYGISKIYESTNLQNKLLQTMLWNHVRSKIQSKVVDVIKSSIPSAIIGEVNPQKETIQYNQKFPINYFYGKKQINQSTNTLQSFINYQKQLNYQLKSMKGFNRIIQSKKIDSLQKQNMFYKLYSHISKLVIFSQISMYLFFDTTKRDILKQIPYSVYRYLWRSFNQFIGKDRETTFEGMMTKDYIVVTNNCFIVEDLKLIQDIVKALRKYKDENHQPLQENANNNLGNQQNKNNEPYYQNPDPSNVSPYQTQSNKNGSSPYGQPSQSGTSQPNRVGTSPYQQQSRTGSTPYQQTNQNQTSPYYQQNQTNSSPYRQPSQTATSSSSSTQPNQTYKNQPNNNNSYSSTSQPNQTASSPYQQTYQNRNDPYQQPTTQTGQQPSKTGTNPNQQYNQNGISPYRNTNQNGSTPYQESSQTGNTPYQQTNTPYQHTNTPYQQTNTPYQQTNPARTSTSQQPSQTRTSRYQQQNQNTSSPYQQPNQSNTWQPNQTGTSPYQQPSQAGTSSYQNPNQTNRNQPSTLQPSQTSTSSPYYQSNNTGTSSSQQPKRTGTTQPNTTENYPYQQPNQTGSSSYQQPNQTGSTQPNSTGTSPYQGTNQSGTSPYQQPVQNGTNQTGTAPYQQPNPSGTSPYQGANQSGTSSYQQPNPSGTSPYQGANQSGTSPYQQPVQNGTMQPNQTGSAQPNQKGTAPYQQPNQTGSTQPNQVGNSAYSQPHQTGTSPYQQPNGNQTGTVQPNPTGTSPYQQANQNSGATQPNQAGISQPNQTRTSSYQGANQSATSPYQQPVQNGTMQPNQTGSTQPNNVTNSIYQQPNQTGTSPYHQPGQIGTSPYQQPGQTGTAPYQQPSQSETSPYQQPNTNQIGSTQPNQTGTSPYQQPSRTGNSPYQQPNQNGPTQPNQAGTVQPNQSGTSPYQQPSQNSSTQPNQVGNSTYQQPNQTGTSPYQQPSQSNTNQPGLNRTSSYQQPTQNGTPQSNQPTATQMNQAGTSPYQQPSQTGTSPYQQQPGPGITQPNQTANSPYQQPNQTGSTQPNQTGTLPNQQPNQSGTTQPNQVGTAQPNQNVISPYQQPSQTGSTQPNPIGTSPYQQPNQTGSTQPNQNASSPYSANPIQPSQTGSYPYQQPNQNGPTQSNQTGSSQPNQNIGTQPNQIGRSPYQQSAINNNTQPNQTSSIPNQQTNQTGSTQPNRTAASPYQQPSQTGTTASPYQQPNQTGSTQPNQTGTSPYQQQHPTQNGLVQSNQPTTIQPNQPGISSNQQPNQTGTAASPYQQTNQTGTVQPSQHANQNSGAAQPNKTGITQPNNTGIVQPNQVGNSAYQQPNQTVTSPNQQPGQTGSTQPGQTGTLPYQQPGQTGSTQPGQIATSPYQQPGQTGTAPYQQPGQTGTAPYQQPGQTGSTQPGQTGTSPYQQPGQTGSTQPGQTGTSPYQQPGQTGTSPYQQPGQTSSTQPGQTGSSQPSQTGTSPYQQPTQNQTKTGQPNQTGNTTQPNQTATSLNQQPNQTTTTQPAKVGNTQLNQTGSTQPNQSATQNKTNTPPPVNNNQTTSQNNNPLQPNNSKTNKSFLSPEHKKKQNQYIQKSQNLQQLSQDQLHSIKDLPNITLQQWQKNSKVKFGQIKSPGKQMFAKFASITQRGPAKQYQYPKPSPDQEILERFVQDHYLISTMQLLNCNNDENLQMKLLTNQITIPTQPLLKDYPIKQFPMFYHQAFNAILKIGLQKNSSKKLHQLLNVIAVPLYKSYYQQLNKTKNMFDEEQMLPSDYTSPHNAIKDEVFIYFAKQITADDQDKFPQKNHYAYLLGFSVFTRYFCPSPKFLFPLTQYIHFLHKTAHKRKQSPQYIAFIQSIFENLLTFIEATQGFKRNPVNVFVQDKNKQRIYMSEMQCSGYLHLRTTPITQSQINKPQAGKKPQPPVITVWLLNNQSYKFPVRNQIVKTLKKKLLAQIGYLQRQSCFQLYFLQPNYTYTLISQKQKVLNLFPLMQIYKSKSLRRPIYLRISHYFPFILKDINTTRLVYLTMISNQVTFPWIAQKYEYIVAQSMAYEQFQQLRIGNYMQFTKQSPDKAPNMKPVQQKFKLIAPEVGNKICQFQYLKYIKSVGFFLGKCYKMEDDDNYIVCVKPIQISMYKNGILLSSISFKRIRNAYKQGKKIVLELYYRNTLIKGGQEPHQRLRTHTIEFAHKMDQLFKDILFYLQNRLG